MTVTFNEDYTEVTLTGSPLDSFVIDSTKVLTLSYSQNCGTAVDHVVSIDDVSVGAGASYTVTAETLGVTFSEGIYQFRFTYQDSPIQISTAYAYINTTIACKLIDWYATKLDCLDKGDCSNNFFYWAYVFDDLLQRFANNSICDSFTYTNACKLWTKLNEILEDDDCGCD